MPVENAEVNPYDFNNAGPQDLSLSLWGIREDEFHSPNRLITSVIRTDVAAYFDMVFAKLPGMVPYRTFEDKGSGQPVVPRGAWRAIDADAPDDRYGFAYSWAESCDASEAACYVIPGTVEKEGQASAVHVTASQVMLADIDSGDVQAKLAHLTKWVAAPTMIVESGGKTAEGQPKVHVYWRLAAPVTDPDGLRLLAQLRKMVAVKVGADTSMGSLHQPIRLPGSVYYKGGNRRLVSIRSYVPKNVYYFDGENGLKGVIDRMPPLEGAGNHMDFNDAGGQGYERAGPSIDHVLTTPVHEGAVDEQTRYDALSTAAGHYIRTAHDGRFSKEEALLRTKAWAEANQRPPFPPERIERDFEKLWKLHIEKNGPQKAVAGAGAVSSFSDDEDFDASEMIGEPPPVEWLVENFIPLGAAGILAAPGGVGKGMLTLDLSLKLTTGPVHAGPNDFSHPVSWMRNRVAVRGNVYLVSGEDTRKAISRRLAKLDPFGLRQNSRFRIKGRAYSDLGGPRALFDRNGEGTAEFAALRAKLLRLSHLVLVVIDPVTPFVQLGLDVDNVAVGRMMGQLSSLAAELNITVLVCHHMNKGRGLASASSLMAAREAIRGAGAIVDGGRFAIVIWEQAQSFQASDLHRLGRKFEAGTVFKGGLCKSNEEADTSLHTLVRDPVAGVLRDETEAVRMTAAQISEDDREFAEAIFLHARENRPFTKTKGDYGVWARSTSFPPRLRESREKMESRVGRLLERGVIVREDKTAFLDHPEGQWAKGHRTKQNYEPGASPTWEQRQAASETVERSAYM